MYPAVKFSVPIFRAIWWTSINDLTNIETKSKYGFSLKFAYESEQYVVVTGNHTVTQHHLNKRVELISFWINGKMSEPVFENSMFTDDKSYEMSIRTWVCIQNATTCYKRAP